MSVHFALDSTDLDKVELRMLSAQSHTLAETRTMARSAMGIFVEIAKRLAPRGTSAHAGPRFFETLGYASKLFSDGIELQHRSGGASGEGVPYANFIVDGTGARHRGGARSGWDVDKFQHFTFQGSEVFTNHTHHEGQKPNDFERGAAHDLQTFLPAIAATGGHRLVRWLRGEAGGA